MSDDRLSRIEAKVDSVVDRLGNIDKTLAAQHVSLKQHMRRSDALEAQVKPMQEHVMAVNGAVKALTWVGSIITLLATLAGTLYMFLGKK